MDVSRRRGPIVRIRLLLNTIMSRSPEHYEKQSIDREGIELKKYSSPCAVGSIKPKLSSGGSDFDPISWLKLIDSPPGCKNEKIYVDQKYADCSLRCPGQLTSSRVSYIEKPHKQNYTLREEDTCDTGKFGRHVSQAMDEHSDGHGSLEETLFRLYDEFLIKRNAAGIIPDLVFCVPCISLESKFAFHGDKKRAGVEMQGKQVNLRRGPKKKIRQCVDSMPPIPERRHLVLRGEMVPGGDDRVLSKTRKMK